MPPRLVRHHMEASKGLSLKLGAYAFHSGKGRTNSSLSLVCPGHFLAMPTSFSPCENTWGHLGRWHDCCTPGQ